MTNSSRAIRIVLGLFLAATPVAAQSGSSDILEGRVQAELGAAVPLADVAVAHTDGFTRRQTVSDARGGFRLGGIFATYFSGDRVTPTITMSPLPEFALPDTSSIGKPPVKLESFFFSTIAGQRLFIQPRGTFRYPPRTSLDLHLERAFRLGRAELSLAMDAFNALGASTISEVQTSVNGNLDLQDFSAYRQTLNRVPPRTFRFGVGIRF